MVLNKYITARAAIVAVLWTCTGSLTNAADGPDFSREIRPLLADRCFACHGPDEHKREAELRLDSFDSLTADRDGRAVVVPGTPDESELIRRIVSSDEDELMPPPHVRKPLSKKEIGLLRRWVEAGAEFSAHWAYAQPKVRPAPNVIRMKWPANWIDLFILNRLEAESLHPAIEADPVTLVRRLHFDLTGLPPDPDVVKKFAAEPSNAAWEKLVDRLLASDAHAERMAVYWLDLVRFADTVGYHGDQDHSISPYRDWVIDAFALNMPFDQFTREQLAGDLLPNSNVDQKIASGYNRLLQTSHEGGVQPKEYLSIYAADRVRNVSAVWLGATVGCAQCHDHKYDPYTSKDFYSLAAFFADLDEDQHFRVGSNGLPTKRPPEIKVHSRREREELAKLERQLTDVESKLKESADNAELQQQKEDLSRTIDTLKKAMRLTMISVAKTPREMRVLPRGNWLDDSGPVVTAAVPEFLGTCAKSTEGRSTRLDLANWICDAESGIGGLTSRVFVNRFWYLMFGNGLARNLDDLGGQGSPPEHPELLDQLAVEFLKSKWNVRHMLKLIVTSRTYRQSSTWTDQLRKRDPQNKLLARQNTFRLSAEMIRDNALAVSGLLVRKVGGASVKPYQPAGYYRHLNFPQRKYTHHADDRQWRRGLYVHWQRQFLHPMLKAFDAPTREECTAQRPRSNTPLAALTLLNDPTFTEAARTFAARLLTEMAEDKTDGRLRLGMELAISRNPDGKELQALRDLLQSATEYYREHPAEAEKVRSAGLAAAGEKMDSIQLAAWTAVARALLNLDESMTRN